MEHSTDYYWDSDGGRCLMALDPFAPLHHSLVTAEQDAGAAVMWCVSRELPSSFTSVCLDSGTANTTPCASSWTLGGLVSRSHCCCT